MNFGMNNFGQPTPESVGALSMAEILKQDPSSLGGLGVVPGTGQMPELQVNKDVMTNPTAQNGEVMDRYAAGGEGGGNMAAILGLQAMKQLGQAQAAAPKVPQPSPGGIAPRGNRVEMDTTSMANPIDPRLYMMMLGGK